MHLPPSPRYVDFRQRHKHADKLEELTMESVKAEQIIQAAKSSMGMDMVDTDLISMRAFAERVVSLADYRKSLYEYLKKKMESCAPNLAALIGEQVGARLISHAGSLTNLAKYPASTVQILGAEKALFRYAMTFSAGEPESRWTAPPRDAHCPSLPCISHRALKTRGNTPKYGLIFHSTFIGRAASKNKGRISRYLANKCSVASRIDCFSDADDLTNKFGEELRNQVEERLNFYESGEAPRKNIDVMRGVMAQMPKPEGEAAVPETPKSDKKKKKAKRSADEAASAEATPKSEKKKAKKAKEAVRTGCGVLMA
jgi:RNA processing factor Prp31